MNYFVGVDLGTTAVKVVLFDENGSAVKEASRELSLVYPATGWAEQDPAAWYEIPCELIRTVCETVPADEVAGISVSSQGISVVPTDAAFRPLRSGISWLDGRAGEELAYLTSVIGPERLFETTGKHPSPLYTLPKLIWLRRHERELFDRADRFLMPMDYFTARTCGAPMTDATMAGGTMLYDLRTLSWSREIGDTFGIPLSKLPEVAPTATLAGRINAETQERTGLGPHVSVAVGAQDQKIAAYGAGMRDGVATMSLGTAGAMEIPSRGKSKALPSFAFRVGDDTCYVLEGCINTFGAAIKWARDNVFTGMSYREMDRLAETAAPGSGGVCFYPHLSGPSTPHFDRPPSSGWRDLSLSTTKADLIRSLYEGLACEVRMNLEAAERSGVTVRELTIFGGGSKSGIICRILADMTGKTVRALAFTEIAAYGAAKAAAVCCGCRSFAAQTAFQEYQPESRTEELYRHYGRGQMI